MSTAAPAAPALRELSAIVGPTNVAENPAAFAIDEVMPRIAVSPGTPEEVAAVMRFAFAQGLTVTPAGGFTRQTIGAVPAGIDILLRLHRLTAVEHYDPGDLTLGIGAGATLADVEQLIGPHRQLLPIDAAQPAAGTIGGALATAAHGPLKHGYGGAREFCIGIRYVTADGKLVKAGARVVKNVAGYDMMKLLIGSFGTLGVITGASFKLFPAPRQTRTFLATFATLADAAGFRDRVARSPLSPMCLELVSPHAHAVLGGTASDGDSEVWRLFVRAGGSDAVLARYRSELNAALMKNGTTLTEITGENESRLWRHLADFPVAVLEKSQNAMLVSLDAAPQAVAPALEAAARATLDNNFLCAALGRIGVGSLTVAFLPLTVDPPAAIQYINALSAFRGALPRDASAIVQRCPLEAKRRCSVWGTTPTDVEAMRAVKRALDERDILNRGRFLF